MRARARPLLVALWLGCGASPAPSETTVPAEPAGTPPVDEAPPVVTQPDDELWLTPIDGDDPAIIAVDGEWAQIWIPLEAPLQVAAHEGPICARATNVHGEPTLATVIVPRRVLIDYFGGHERMLFCGGREFARAHDEHGILGGASPWEGVRMRHEFSNGPGAIRGLSAGGSSIEVSVPLAPSLPVQISSRIAGAELHACADPTASIGSATAVLADHAPNAHDPSIEDVLFEMNATDWERVVRAGRATAFAFCRVSVPLRARTLEGFEETLDVVTRLRPEWSRRPPEVRPVPVRLRRATRDALARAAE